MQRARRNRSQAGGGAQSESMSSVRSCDIARLKQASHGGNDLALAAQDRIDRREQGFDRRYLEHIRRGAGFESHHDATLQAQRRTCWRDRRSGVGSHRRARALSRLSRPPPGARPEEERCHRGGESEGGDRA